MKFIKRIEKIKSENRDKIVLARCGAFVVAIGNDAVFLSKMLGLKRTCLNRICKVGVPVTYTMKYLEIIERKGYSYILYDYNKETKAIEEKYRYDGINKVEEVSIDCKNCECYKKENYIDIFEILKNKENKKDE